MRQPQKSSVSLGNVSLLFRDSFLDHFDEILGLPLSSFKVFQDLKYTPDTHRHFVKKLRQVPQM